ncbi:MAG: hypothetical protein Q8P86_04140 [bacterium]|nr:hypothetical protein [bacterium]
MRDFENSPRVTNISGYATRQFWKKFKKNFIFLLLFLAVLFLIAGKMSPSGTGSKISGGFFSYIFLTILLIPAIWYGTLYVKAKEAFWKQFAKSRGWTHKTYKNLNAEKALLFKEGHSGKVGHIVEGNYQNHSLQIFEYVYVTGSGKHKSDHYYTVFEVLFDGTFPHLYLNNHTDSKHFGLTKRFFPPRPRLSLPSEFENKFHLYVPKEYEIEAYEVFSPDTLQFLIDFGWQHDLELVDGELLIFRQKHINSLSELEEELNLIQKFIDHLAPKLNRLKLHQIGDHLPVLG